MPTLTRFLTVCLLLAGLIYGAMLALVYLVKPRDREIVVEIPLEQLGIGDER
jgi:hypothetical protein